jgi:hypothetical protein
MAKTKEKIIAEDGNHITEDLASSIRRNYKISRKASIKAMIC